jgi:hypothetical protein
VSQLIHSELSPFSPFQKQRSKLSIQNKETATAVAVADSVEKLTVKNMLSTTTTTTATTTPTMHSSFNNRQVKNNENSFNDISLKAVENGENIQVSSESEATNDGSLYKGIVFRLRSFFSSDKEESKKQFYEPNQRSSLQPSSNKSTTTTNSRANRVQSDSSEAMSRIDFLDLSANDKSSQKTNSLEMRTASKSSVSTNGSRFSWQLMSNLLLPKSEKTYEALFDVINSNDRHELKKFIEKCLPTELNYICTQKNLKDLNQQTILHYLAYYPGKLNRKHKKNKKK